jgi:hypothetical protein
MKFDNSKRFDEYLNHHTLLYGETNTKKTYYTAMFVQFLVESSFNPKEITILDFAPKMITINGLKVGGRIEDFYENSKACKNLFFEGEIIPPRLHSTNLEELNANARNNFNKTNQILEEYAQNPTEVLVINDISIYLHNGKLQFLLKIIKKACTFFGNTYYGTSINRNFTYDFSLKEKKFVEALVEKIEVSYSTD